MKLKGISISPIENKNYKLLLHFDKAHFFSVIFEKDEDSNDVMDKLHNVLSEISKISMDEISKKIKRNFKNEHRNS